MDADAEPGFEARLDRLLAARVPGVDGLIACERLSGGASQESYRLTVRAGADERRLALRRAPDGAADAATSPQIGLEAEAALMRLAGAAGVPEPEILHVLEPGDGLGRGFVMSWVDGETLGARIARSETFTAARPSLAFQCGEILARIHALDVAATGLSGRFRTWSPEALVRRTWQDYLDLAVAQPMIDFTARWLLENLPAASRTALVHADFRNGNLIVDAAKGVVAVLDWEVAHLGDPMRDLGWICTPSWRFGVRERPVGGFGAREDLFAGYAAGGGGTVDPAHVRFWEVFGSFWWAIGCLRMGRRYRDGVDATVEKPGIARRSSECQVDCAAMLIPGPVALPEMPAAASRASLSLDLSASAELLESVRDFLRGAVMTETRGRTNFLARVGANSLDIVLRELALAPAHRAWQREVLADLLGEAGEVAALEIRLSQRLREGAMALDAPGLAAFLRRAVATQCAIDQPGYAGLRELAAADG